MVDREKLAQLIIELRKKRGYSQRKLAMVSGVSNSTISRIESAISDADPETLKKLAPFLGVSYETLMQAAGYIDNESIDSNTKVSENKTKNIEQIEKEYKKEIEFLERFRQEMINRGFEYYKDKTHEELADIVVKHLKIQEILDGNNNKSN